MDEGLPRRDLLRYGALGALVAGAVDAAPPPGGTARPEEFGAAGDGETDDTAAVQQAADTGGGLLLTAGRTYLIDRLALPNRDGWTLEGGGATLRKRDDGDNYALLASAVHLDNGPWAGLPVQIRNLRLDGAQVGTACAGFVHQSWNSRLCNLAITNMTGDGLRVASTTRDGQRIQNTCVNNWFEMVQVSGCGGHGVHIDDRDGGKLTDWYIGGGWIYDNGGWGIFADELAGCQIGPKLHLYSNRGGGLHAGRWSVGTVIQGVYFESGQHCRIPGGWRPGILGRCYFIGDARLEIGFGQGGGIHRRVTVSACGFTGEAHIVHRGGAEHVIEVIGCNFDTPDPLRRTGGGRFHATRCWADGQERLIDGDA